MTEQNSDRIGNILKNGSVKRHFFHPSGREVWTVVGKDNEYWADPDLEFCCCKYFYYVAITRGTLCYHLSSILRAQTEGKYVSTGFDDSEYNDFVSALISDILSSLLAV
jgi:predicted nucleic acid-binding Zn finger protein